MDEEMKANERRKVIDLFMLYSTRDDDENASLIFALHLFATVSGMFLFLWSKALCNFIDFKAR